MFYIITVIAIYLTIKGFLDYRKCKKEKLPKSKALTKLVIGVVLVLIAISIKPEEEKNIASVSETATTTKSEQVEQEKEKDKKKEKPTKTKTFDFTLTDFENRINAALKEMGDKTNLKAASSEKKENGSYVIVLSENIMFFVVADDKTKEVEKVSLASTTQSLFLEKEDLDFSFLLLVGTVDDSLSFGDRHTLVQELGLKEKNLMDHTEVVNKNDIQYTYKGDKNAFLLQAVPK